jgi:hypothetical protein
VIRAEDAQFHPPTTDDPLWAETNYFGLYAGQDTERPLNIGVYGLFREPLGVVGATVSVNSRRVTMPWAADYWDAWEHLVVPQPSDLLDYRLANGLSVRCTEPNRVWDVDYADPAAGLELHFRCTALMDPYDINDPDMDPMAARVDMDKTWGHAYAGHFDLTGPSRASSCCAAPARRSTACPRWTTAGACAPSARPRGCPGSTRTSPPTSRST